MKPGKAPGVDNVTAEHIVYAHPAIVMHLTKLFNAMIVHGYVPNNFGTSIIVPLVKDRCGDVSKLANYRAISLSPVFAKLFEACMSSKFGVYLHSRDLQFGFKKHSSCTSAVYVAQQVIQYYAKRGSTVYIAALDASKAFDRINHNTLVNKLRSRDSPMCFIQIIVNWYSKLSATVRWNGVLSRYFNVYCGVRQGGVLSPLLFNLYVDDLLVEFEAKKLGCCLSEYMLAVLCMRMTSC